MIGVVVDEEGRYWKDGERVPGVNEILKKVGLSKDSSFIDPFYLERGKAVHLAVQYHLAGTLDNTSLDPVIIPYFEGAKKFLSTLKKPVIGFNVEEKLYSQRLNFAGILDLVADDIIWDWKCSKSPDPVSELQGAAYSLLWGENYGVDIPFRVVRLPGDGSYDVINYNTTDPNLWDSVMSLYRWRMKRAKAK